ncbi:MULTISPECIES: ATP-binding domain-containing protein [unclassified Carboxylicivirga]|uniref:ATP-binding domain-containing protein n=1 Tax=Carboxylicivirga TaxID=1628153 RepID=UPI003D35295E
MPRSFYIQEAELDDFQTRVINRRTDNSFIVKGCAGSGKSILALWKVKQIQEEGRGSFYFILFTKTLKQYMRDAIVSLNLNNDNVMHYERWKRLGCPSADYLIVDEAQDFAECQVKEFTNSANRALILYGDSAQQIYTFRDPKPITMEDIAYITRLKDEQLVWNYRLPKKVARLAEYLSEVHDDLEGRCKLEGTEKPKILRYNTLHEQFDAIIQIVRNRNYDDVGIFLQNNQEVENAKNYFQEKGFPVEAKFRNNMDLDFSNDLPKLTTYHSSKGLQFEAVFMPDCKTEYDDARSSLYVATTRTYQSLFIMHSGNLSSFFDEVPNNLYETSLTSQSSRRL